MSLRSAVLVSVERGWVSSDQRHVCKPSLWSPHACCDSDVPASHKWSTNNYYNNGNNKILFGKINFTKVRKTGKEFHHEDVIGEQVHGAGFMPIFHFFRVLSERSQSSESLSIWKQPYPRISYKASSLRAPTVRLHDLTCVLERKKINWSI